MRSASAGPRRAGRGAAGRHPALLAAVALAGLLGGCGSPLPRVADDADAGVVPCGWNEEGALAPLRSLRDVLPNTRFRQRGTSEPAAPLTPLVVVGEVVAVAPGPGWTEAGDRVGFDDDAALWKQAHATVRVREVLGSAGWAADTVTVAFPLLPDEELEPASRALLRPGRWVLPLYQEQAARDPGVWSVGPLDAVLVADVGPGGRLALPCVPPRQAARLLADVPTLAELRRAAAGPLRERVVAPAPLG